MMQSLRKPHPRRRNGYKFLVAVSGSVGLSGAGCGGDACHEHCDTKLELCVAKDDEFDAARTFCYENCEIYASFTCEKCVEAADAWHGCKTAVVEEDCEGDVARACASELDAWGACNEGC